MSGNALLNAFLKEASDEGIVNASYPAPWMIDSQWHSLYFLEYYSARLAGIIVERKIGL